MNRITTYLKESRLHLYSFIFGGVLLGSAYGSTLRGAFSLSGFVLAVLISLLCHVATSFANELADDEADAANENRTMFNGGTGQLQSGAITRAELAWGWKIAALLSAALTCIVVFAAGYHPILLSATAVGLVLGVGYSLSPLALSRTGFGEIAAFLAYGVPTLACGAVLQVPRGSVGVLFGDGFFYLLAIPGALMVFITLSLTMIPDTESDLAGGRRSVSVILGSRNVLVMAAVLLVADAAFFPLFLGLGRYGVVFTILSAVIPLSVAGLILGNRSAWEEPTGKAMMRIMTMSVNATMAAFILPAAYILIIS